MSRNRKDWSQMVQEYESKTLSTKQITEKYGISRQRVHQILQRHGVQSHTSRKNKLTDKDTAMIANAYRNLGSIARVAKRFNTTQYQVNQALGRQNIVPTIHKFDDEDIADWNERYDCGETIASIAISCGLSRETVSQHLSVKKRKTRALHNSVRDKVLDLYKAGKTITDAASEAGCSAPTATRYITGAGIKRPVAKNKQQQRILDIAADHKSGMTIADISAKHKVSERLVTGILSSFERK